MYTHVCILITFTVEILFRIIPCPESQRFSPTFSSCNFMVLPFTFFSGACRVADPVEGGGERAVDRKTKAPRLAGTESEGIRGDVVCARRALVHTGLGQLGGRPPGE